MTPSTTTVMDIYDAERPNSNHSKYFGETGWHSFSMKYGCGAVVDVDLILFYEYVNVFFFMYY